jgi:hypothetical protein
MKYGYEITPSRASTIFNKREGIEFYKSTINCDGKLLAQSSIAEINC